MTGGTVGALVTGASMPFFNILFGEMLDELNGNPDQFDSAINRIAYSFIVVSVINIFTGFLQVIYYDCCQECPSPLKWIHHYMCVSPAVLEFLYLY